MFDVRHIATSDAQHRRSRPVNAGGNETSRCAGRSCQAELRGVESTVVERVEFNAQAGVIVASARPGRGHGAGAGRAGGAARPMTEARPARRRALDLGTVPAFVEAA